MGDTMLRSVKAFFAAVLFAGCLSAASAANIPLLSGPVEPSQMQATINQLIRSINSGTTGILSSKLTAVATGTGTSEQTLQTYTLQPGTLPVGAVLDVKCWGTTGATANNKTRKLYYGASNIATATEAANAQNWYLELFVLNTGSATQSVMGRGIAGTGGVTPLSYINQGTDDQTAAVTVKCTGTDATSAAEIGRASCR